MAWAMLLAAWLAAITLPKIAPHKKRMKNFPAKVNAPSGPNGKYSRNAFGTNRPLVKATTKEHTSAAMKMFTPFAYPGAPVSGDATKAEPRPTPSAPLNPLLEAQAAALEQMRRQMEEMQSQLSRLSGAPPKP